MQVLQQLDAGHGGHTSQLAQEARRCEAGIVLQLARWMAETGQGAKADLKGGLQGRLRQGRRGVGVGCSTRMMMMSESLIMMSEQASVS